MGDLISLFKGKKAKKEKERKKPQTHVVGLLSVAPQFFLIINIIVTIFHTMDISVSAQLLCHALLLAL